MRIAFLIVVLAGSVFYSYVAFADLNFMTRTGRLGPGFFPRAIGVAMIVFAIWTLADSLRDRAQAANEEPGTWGDVTTLVALAVVYAVLLRIFGGFAATIMFLALALSFLNRGKHLQNAVLSVVLPACFYLLFDKVLNANMPPGLIDLPI